MLDFNSQQAGEQGIITLNKIVNRFFFLLVFGIGKEKNKSQCNLNEYYMNNTP